MNKNDVIEMKINKMELGNRSRASAMHQLQALIPMQEEEMSQGIQAPRDVNDLSRMAAGDSFDRETEKVIGIDRQKVKQPLKRHRLRARVSNST